MTYPISAPAHTPPPPSSLILFDQCPSAALSKMSFLQRKAKGTRHPLWTDEHREVLTTYRHLYKSSNASNKMLEHGVKLCLIKVASCNSVVHVIL